MKEKNIRNLAIVTALLVLLVWAAYLFRGNRYERIGSFQVYLPFGSYLEHGATAEVYNGTIFQINSWSFSHWQWNVLWVLTCTQDNSTQWAKYRERDFPNILREYRDRAVIGPVSHITIDGMPFERVTWSSNLHNYYVLGFDIRSVPLKNQKEVIWFDALPCDSQQEITDLEKIVMTVKHN